MGTEQEQLIAKLREENDERNEDYKACAAQSNEIRLLINPVIAYIPGRHSHFGHDIPAVADDIQLASGKACGPDGYLFVILLRFCPYRRTKFEANNKRRVVPQTYT